MGAYYSTSSSSSGSGTRAFIQTSSKSSSIYFNGKKYTGSQCTIDSRGNVFIDGQRIDNDQVQQQQALSIAIEGNVERVEAASGDVTITGNAGTVTTASGNVNVSGDVLGATTSMSGNITAAKIHGSVSTMSGDIRHR